MSIVLDVRRKGAPQFLKQRIERGISEGYSVFKIKTPQFDSLICPSMCVPIAGIIDQYVSQGCRFIESRSLIENQYLYRTHIISPVKYSSEKKDRDSFLDVVWKFSREDLYEIVGGIVHSVRKSIATQSGVIESLELCLNEIADNVLVHSVSGEHDSDRAFGYVMAQVHKDSSNIVVAVYDGGQGIWASFRGSEHNPSSSEEAISLALSKNITSGFGQGRGMWILSSIVEFGKGSIEITSDKARYSLKHRNNSDISDPVLSKINTEIEGTTLVDFWLDASNGISIEQALDGHKLVDLWVESHEADNDNLVFWVKEESRGTGSRYAARQFKHILLNTAQQSARDIDISFKDVEVVSSSYADELFGKMIQEIGIVAFSSRFRIVDVSRTNAFIIDEAVKTRLAQEGCQSQHEVEG